MLMLTLGGDMLPWRSPLVIGLGVSALALGAAFVAHLRRAPEPLIPPSIFANRVVDKASLSMFFGMLVYVAAVVYCPLYFEICLGLDPTAAGVGLIVVLGASVIGSNFTGLNLPKVKRYKTMGYVGLPAAALALGALSALAPDLNIWGAEALILVYGLGLGTLFPTLTVSVQNAADPRDMGAATATLAFVRSLGSALGVAVFGAVIFAYGLGEKSVGAGADPAAAAPAFRAAFALMAVADRASAWRSSSRWRSGRCAARSRGGGRADRLIGSLHATAPRCRAGVTRASPIRAGVGGLGHRFGLGVVAVGDAGMIAA